MRRHWITPTMSFALALVTVVVLASATREAKSAPLQAFPAIAGFESSQAPRDQPVVVDLPLGIVAGDRLLVEIAAATSGGNDLGAPPSGWTQVVQNVDTFSVTAIYTRVADGSEGISVTMPWTHHEPTKHWSARVTGADPAATAISTSVDSGTTMTPDPLLHTPSWGEADTLWIAWLGLRGTTSLTSYPPDYTYYQFFETTSGLEGSGASIAVAARQFRAASQDPGPFTFSAATGNSSFGTLAIKPAGTPPGPSPGGQSTGTFCGRGSLALTGSCTLSDPVNTLTGAFVTQVQDLATPGTGVSFAWTRSYTSSDATVGALGPGWTHTFGASLAVQGNGDVLARGEEGQQLYFTKQGDGSFVDAAGGRASLTSIAGGYKLVRQDQVTYVFDNQGRLTSIKDRNDQGVTLAYDGQGRLSTIIDAAARQTTVSYNASNLVSQVQAQDGRSVSYGYTSGRLTSVTDVRGKIWTYTYDAGGRLATIVDPLSHTQVTNVYGTDGRVQSQTDAVGKTTTFAWDPGTELATVTDANNKLWKHDHAQSILATETDPLNNVTQLGHDADLNTSSVTGPTSETTSMIYDASGNMLSATAPTSLGSVQKTFVYNAKNDPTQITDARNKVTSYTYTPAGDTQTVTQDGTQVGSYTYDSAGRVLTFTDGRSKTWTYTYFPATGYQESVTDPLGNKTTFTYDAAGRVLTRVDPKGNVAGCGCAAQFTWTYTYNPAGQQLTESNPLGQTTTNVYDDAGRLVSVTDANNHVTSYTYDNADRVLTETKPDPDGGGPLTSPVIVYTYDNVGNKLTETDPRGNTTTFAYDSANRLASQTGPDPDGAGPLAAPVTTYAYEANGNLESTVEPRGNVAGCNCTNDFRTSYTYDAAGRRLTETRPDPDGAGPQTAPVTTNTYDAVGNLASVRDGNNHTTSYTYDAAGRVLTVTAPDLGVTTYTYDPVGNLLTRRDDNNHTTTLAYDDASRLSSETGPDPDGAGPQTAPLTTHTYDENGNELTLTDPNGNATPAPGDGQATNGYDRANRLTSINYSDATPDVSFTYDAVGNRLTMVDGSGTETRTYDHLDRLSSVTRGTDTFSYAYDPASNLTSRTYPGSVATTYAYDALDRLSTAVNASLTTSYAYDPASNLTQTTLPAANGHVETRVYDRAGRLIEVKNERGAMLRSRFLITLDPASNPTRIDRTGTLVQTQTYSYDASDRILTVCFAASCTPTSPDRIAWTYDKVGNRLSETRSMGMTNYSYDARDRLLSAGSTSYTYDQNGNQLSAGGQPFTYDLANRLKTMTQGATTTTYTYDGEGKRLQASTGTAASAKTNFLWDISNALAQVALERNGNNVLQRQYIYGLRRIRQTQGTGTYYLYDGLGSVVNTTAPLGALQKTLSYEPFGVIRTTSGSSPTNFWHFTGEYLDPTGLYHLRARQYDPALGRFTRLDPARSRETHPYVSAYVYAADRPTVMIDPTGLTFRPSEGGQAAAQDPTSPAGKGAVPMPEPGAARMLSSASSPKSVADCGTFVVAVNIDDENLSATCTTRAKLRYSGGAYTIQTKAVRTRTGQTVSVRYDGGRITSWWGLSQWGRSFTHETTLRVWQRGYYDFSVTVTIALGAPLIGYTCVGQSTIGAIFVGVP